jgi:hypothetical protein
MHKFHSNRIWIAVSGAAVLLAGATLFAAADRRLADAVQNHDGESARPLLKQKIDK